MRRLLAAILILVMAGIVPVAQAQDDGLELVCSSPADGALLGVIPGAVTLYFSADVAELEVAVANPDGDNVAQGDAEIDGAVVVVALDADSLATETEYMVEVTVGEDTFSRSFTIGPNALALEDAELANDCPADMMEETPAEEETPVEEETPDEEETPAEEETPVEEETPDEEETPAEEETPVEEETPDEEETPAEEETPVEEETPMDEPMLAAEPLDAMAGNQPFTVGVPAGFVTGQIDDYFLFPVTVMASSEDVIQSYVDDPDSVREYVVIFTSFSSEDLEVFGLDADADGAAIIQALIRQDSNAGDPVETTVADATALEVTFTNDTSEKAGVFYLVRFVGDEADEFLLIQGSAPMEEWEELAPAFQAVVDSIMLVTEEE